MTCCLGFTIYKCDSSFLGCLYVNRFFGGTNKVMTTLRRGRRWQNREGSHADM